MTVLYRSVSKSYFTLVPVASNLLPHNNLARDRTEDDLSCCKNLSSKEGTKAEDDE